MNDSNIPRGPICVVTPHLGTYSETFIQAHLDHLPNKLIHLYGGWFPAFQTDGKPFRSLVHRISSRIDTAVSAGKFAGVIQTRSLSSYLSKHDVSTVLAEYGPCGASVMPACRASKTPLVVHFHGMDAFDSSIVDEYRHLYKEMFAEAAALVTPSHHMAQHLSDMGSPPDRTLVNPYGVDLSRFRSNPQYPDTDSATFLAVGRFVEKKAPFLTLLAFKTITEQREEARLNMVGDGPLLGASQQLAHSLGLRDKVAFLGVQPPKEVARLMLKARAFVQHSTAAQSGDSEGLPVAILEAGASGLPVIATKHAGIPEAVIDLETGFLVEEGDISRMSQRMIQVLDDPELAKRLGKAARKRIEAKFSLERSVSRLWEIIKQATAPSLHE